MSYVNRVWMATSVAVLNSHSEQGQKLMSGLKSLNHSKKRFISSGGGDAADLRPLTRALNTDSDGSVASNGGDETTARQADDALRQVMYLNCWGQS